MGEGEAVGDLVSGALVASAVEPATGLSADGHTTEQLCLNCRTPLTGPYCHQCGQRGHVHRTLSAFFHDLVHGVLHFEGKIWNTLPMLAWKPGELTRRYIDGERARFVSPIALFLFSVFLMFAAAGIFGAAPHIDNQAIQSELAEQSDKDEAIVRNLEELRAKAQASGQRTVEIDRKIVDAKENSALVRELSQKGVVRGSAVRVSNDVPAWIADPLRKAAANPELLFYKVRTNAYKFSWLLIPLSVPFLWLLFPFSRRFRLYDHTVFVTYSLAAMSFLVLAVLVLGSAGATAAAVLLFFVPPLHMYRQLRGTYGLSRWSAVLRTTLLVLFALVAVSLFIILLFTVGLF